ncbi:MAG: tRNA (adenosine(37)-N6)-dimethylallyltransferase MiaA [Clostridia bacterium]|nr:tRNA (adenosine(37)-N6)-dimethylallyltransferase MiaA [Clostridia bacterium]
MNKPLIPVIVGPTASGKTSLSIEIAKKIGGEIVSADSMQIYENMDIATAKPTVAEMQGIPHHLIGFLSMGENFSVAAYKQKAMLCIKDIISRGKTPVVVGGTGLYVDTLVNNTEFLDYEKSDIREKLEKKAEQEGIGTLLSELSEVDPETAARLHFNDAKRIIRALEVYYSTGKTITEQCELSHRHESEYDWCLIGITAEDRQFLYDRINHRVDLMVKNGLIEEAESFFASNCSKTAKQAIGYKELKPYFDGLVTLDEALEKLKMETRRYAKRQLTWFRRNEKINWLKTDMLSKEQLIESALNIIDEHGRQK